MNKYYKAAAVMAAVSSLAIGAPAAASPVSDAAALRKLDIMLMVSSLRCRFGPDNFQADYERFSAAQHSTMQEAFLVLQADYNGRMGPVGGKKRSTASASGWPTSTDKATRGWVAVNSRQWRVTWPALPTARTCWQ